MQSVALVDSNWGCVCDPRLGWGGATGVEYAILCIAVEQFGMCRQSFELRASTWRCVCNPLHEREQLDVCMQSSALFLIAFDSF